MSKFKKKSLPKGDIDDEDFDAFMKESVSSEDSTLDTGRIAKYLDSPRRRPNNLYDISDDDDDDSDGGLMGTGKMFLKKKTPERKKPQPAARQISNKHIKDVQDLGMNRDSLEDESLSSYHKDKGKLGMSNNGISVPELNLGASSASYTDTVTGQCGAGEPNVVSLKVGKETLDELAEKDRFFKELERGADATVDYSKLNRELDQQETLYGGATLNITDQLPEEDESVDSESADELPGVKPRMQQHRHQTDQQDEEQHLLSKVALMDSMDSSLGSKPAASRDREMRDMHTIQESSSGRDHEGLDEPDAIIYQPSIDQPHYDDTEITDTHGVTFKSHTGYGDTSRDLEKEYQNQLKVGMATTEDLKAFTLKDSSSMHGKSSIFNTQKTIAGTLGSDQNEDTPPYALSRIPVGSDKKDERTADDLLKQAKELRRPEDRPSVHFNVPSQDNGHDVSPPQSYKSDEPSALELSPIAKHQDSLLKAAFETSQGLDSSAQQESTPVAASKSKPKVRERFSHIKSSGYGRKQSAMSADNSTDIAKIAPQPDEVRPPLTDSTESPKVSSRLHNGGFYPKAKPGVQHNEHLMSSIASLVAQLQGEITARDRPVRPKNVQQSQPEAKWSADGPVLSSSQRVSVMEREQGLIREVRQWQDQWKEERKIHAKLKVDLDAQEKHYSRLVEQLRVDQEQEVFKLKQQNFVLSAKVVEDASPPKALPNADVTADDQQVRLMEKEIREQEKLLAGYQRENQRIYEELKTLQKSSKDVETRMFKENQRLQNEVVSLREDITRKDVEIKNKGLITSPGMQQQIAGGHVPGSAALGANRIAQLEAKLKAAMRQEELLYLEIETHKQAKHDLELQMDGLMKQLNDMGNRVNDVTAINHKSNQHREDKREKDVDKLQKKLKWYAENQQLLDKDKHVILAKDEEIKRLRTKLNGLSTETGRRAAEMRSKTKERSMDAKRIQDLERQVKEMENILKKRYPDSIPMMIWAANHLPESDTTSSVNKPASVQFLETRIAKLEKEREQRDDESKRDLRVLEQKYSAMKVQYEERINDLEERLCKYERPGDHHLKEGARPHSSASAIQRELDSIRERSKRELSDVRSELDKLRKENASLKNKETVSARIENRTAKDKECDLELRVKALQLEVSHQERDKQHLKLTVEKLQKEKQQISAETVRNPGRVNHSVVNGRRNQERRPKSAGSVRSRSLSRDRDSRTRSRSRDRGSDLPPYTDDYVRDKYEPDVFAGQHVSDVMRENEELKLRVERLQFDTEQQRVNLSKVVAESEDRERRIRESNYEELSALKTAHQHDVTRLYTETAVQYSTSKVAALSSKVDTQEVAIKFLKDQLQVARTDSEQLAALKIRETALETQVRQVVDDLREAKKHQTPEMRHFESLTHKIMQLESRRDTRERELQQIIQQTRLSANADFNEEVERWRRIVEIKNKEIEHFKTELDSILEVLRELQRQGVLLPGGKDGYPPR